MSKRGLVADSDVLRIEHGDAIAVTTVYPGYIRTPIHRRAEELGISLQGLVPEESVRHAAEAIADAALGEPRRDVATSRRAAVGYTLLRIAPRRLVDRLVRHRLRRAVSRGAFEGSELAAPLRARLLGD
jgi:NAD(P)-dependent dehydrogenase (short-subunit alcohol dehydrogenase family)